MTKSVQNVAYSYKTDTFSEYVLFGNAYVVEKFMKYIKNDIDKHRNIANGHYMSNTKRDAV